ncbi:MAG: hypothetical protein M3N97_15755 [Pseudomonadota bacterium]|nr:hypothetical protein [Pseudomonadota bacterium]
MSLKSIAVASIRSFGDFVIAHSVLRRVAEDDKDRVRLISCGHVEDLNAVLSNEVCVTLLHSGEHSVPAVFDVKKRGALAALRSALSLRREFGKTGRDRNETLAFHSFGMRERFIAGSWPAIAPRTRCANIYETYRHFLSEHDIRTTACASPMPSGCARSVGIFPESRLAEKRLTAQTLSVVIDQVVRAGMSAKLFVLDEDIPSEREFPCTVRIDRNFASLASAIGSVDFVISADSLPAHLAEYFGRPVFVALPFHNEYWLPHGCFSAKHWGIFHSPRELSVSLDGFLAKFQGAVPLQTGLSA